MSVQYRFAPNYDKILMDDLYLQLLPFLDCSFLYLHLINSTVSFNLWKNCQNKAHVFLGSEYSVIIFIILFTNLLPNGISALHMVQVLYPNLIGLLVVNILQLCLSKYGQFWKTYEKFCTWWMHHLVNYKLVWLLSFNQ